jgi:hypothetical protein
MQCGLVASPGGIVTSVFDKIDSNGCGIVLDLRNVNSCEFRSVTCQGVRDRGIVMRDVAKVNANHFHNLYFENSHLLAPLYQYAIDIVGGQGNYFYGGTFAQPEDIFHFGPGASNNYVFANNKLYSVKFESGSERNKIVSLGDPIPYVVDLGRNNVIEYMRYEVGPGPFNLGCYVDTHYNSPGAGVVGGIRVQNGTISTI